MSLPYEAPLITKLLRRMSDADLARTEPVRFQTWPAAVVLKAAVIRELITNERRRRT